MALVVKKNGTQFSIQIFFDLYFSQNITYFAPLICGKLMISLLNMIANSRTTLRDLKN